MTVADVVMLVILAEVSLVMLAVMKVKLGLG